MALSGSHLNVNILHVVAFLFLASRNKMTLFHTRVMIDDVYRTP